jgi:hypothetical protein
MMGIQVCSNKNDHPSFKEEIVHVMKNAKIAWGHLKVFSGTVSPEKFKFT